MKQEDKELLLADICSRLPYGVKAQYYDEEEQCETWDVIEGVIVDTPNPTVDIGQYALRIEKVKPYLFPMSAMTRKQIEEYTDLCAEDTMGGIYYFSPYSIDWLCKNHFDYRGLIPKGLANDATGKNIY